MVEINPNLIPTSFYNQDTQTLKVDKKQAEAVQAGIQAVLDRLPDVEKGAFLASTAKLVPGDVDTPEKLRIALAAFEVAAKAASDPSSPAAVFVGDVSRFLARVMIELAADQRENALNDRLAARESAKGELLSQADQMDKAASKMKAGAQTQMITGIIAGSVAAVGAVGSAAGTASQIGKMGQAKTATQTASKQASQAADDVNQAQKIATRVGTNADKAKTQNILHTTKQAHATAEEAQKTAQKTFEIATAKSQLFTTLGQVGHAVGETVRSGGSGTDQRLQAEAKEAEAEGSRDAAEAQYAQQTADMKKDMQESMNDMIKQIINFIKEMREAEVEAMRALTKV